MHARPAPARTASLARTDPQAASPPPAAILAATHRTRPLRAVAPRASRAQELRSITASRTGGSGSLLESFDKTKSAVAGGKVDRGIRAKLAAEASNAPKAKAAGGAGGAGGFKFGFGGSSNSSGPKPSKPAAPKFSAPKPAAPKPAAAAGGAGAGAGASLPAPLLQAAAVLGFVGVGANAVTSAATSKVRAARQRCSGACRLQCIARLRAPTLPAAPPCAADCLRPAAAAQDQAQRGGCRAGARARARHHRGARCIACACARCIACARTRCIARPPAR